MVPMTKVNLVTHINVQMQTYIDTIFHTNQQYNIRLNIGFRIYRIVFHKGDIIQITIEVSIYLLKINEHLL